MTDQHPNLITPQDLEGVTISAARVEMPLFSVGGNGTPIVTIHRDGRLEFSSDYDPDAAARAFWEAVQRLQPTFEQQTGIRHVEAKLRAGAFRDGADRIGALRDELIPDPQITGKYLAGLERAQSELHRMAKETDPK